ncbi:zinc-dependent alcohol dehydrogenase family protein [Sphingomonas sp. C8-2]|jgi:NADPH:quinone reductase-like Zn-dependent oxidoreductase|nr:zinc-dependent alcohol dehydrogenase family protein [Sphingomonas sp. C8-2]
MDRYRLGFDPAQWPWQESHMKNVLLVDLVDGENRFVIRPIDMAEPGPGEVRYQVHAIGLNRADLLYLNGGHYTPTMLPSRVGFEACGIVTSVGEGVTACKPGDRVTAIPHGDPKYSVGGEFAITPAQYLAPWPEGYSAAEAAGAWMQYLTAYFPLKEIAKVGPGDAILVTAASSSAGLGGIQLGKLLGARVVASTRSAAKRDFLLGAGADHVVVMDEGDVSGQIMAATGGRGVRAVYEAVAGKFFYDYAEALAPGAQIFVYGAMSGTPTIEIPIVPFIRVGAQIQLYSLINYLRGVDAVDRSRLFVGLAMQAGAIRPIIDKVFKFEDALDAYAYMESGDQKGKIVLETQFAR